MTGTNRIRIATTDSAEALDIACSEVESAVGLPVKAELQEIEGGCLILELRLGTEHVHVHVPPPSRLAMVVDKAVPNIEVLSAWREPSASCGSARPCDAVLAVPRDAMPPLALRAVSDNVATAQWEVSDRSWRLAVPFVNATKAGIVGLAHRRGYSFRFTSLDAAAIRIGLAS